MRHINRELTPTISDVYHERSLGLGLAPPLAKLLLNQGQAAAPQTDSTVLEKITLGILEDTELADELTGMTPSKMPKPWLADSVVANLQQIQNSELTTADILEREVKNKKIALR